MADAGLRLRSVGNDDEEDNGSSPRLLGSVDGDVGDADEAHSGEDAPSQRIWQRRLSVEEMAFALAQDEIAGIDKGTVAHERESGDRSDTPAAVDTGSDAAGVDESVIEETAFGLPQVDINDAREPRKSSLQMITAAARQFRELHRASSRHLTDPDARTLVAARRALWREVGRTVGFALLFADAMYVLISVPLRLGFFFDPWDHTHARQNWTDTLTLFSALDVIGELVRFVYVLKLYAQRLQPRAGRSSRSSAPASTASITARQYSSQRSYRFARPQRSLFSARGSVSSKGLSVKEAEVLSTVARTKVVENRHATIRLAALAAGSLPIELAIASLNYNWLHAVRVSKLLIIVYSLTPSYSVLLLKCRRFRWAQYLSFSTLALPFYLFWLGLYLCHLSACGYMLIANIECGLNSQYCSKTPIPGSWVLKDNMEQAALWRRYVRTMYWASKTLSTLGQSDLVPATLVETNYGVVVQIISGLWATAFLASCSFYFSRRDRDIENGVSTRLEQALRFLKSRKVPSTLAMQIRNYYQHIQRTRNGIEEHQVLSNLPPHYRYQCSFFVKYRLLAKIPFFSKQPKVFLRSIVDSVESDFLPPKQTILARFEVVELIIVARGDVNVLDESKDCVRMVGQNEWFGEEALFEDSRSKFELEAKSFCEIMRLPRQHFLACMEKHFPRLKIAAMLAQQQRRVAMIPFTDLRLKQVTPDPTSGTGRIWGRCALSVILQRVFGKASEESRIPWQYPGSAFRKKWRRWKAGLMLFVALEVPFEVAFEWRVGFFEEHTKAGQRMLYLVVVLVEIFFYTDWFFRVFVFARASIGSSLKREESVRDVTQRSMREDLVFAAAVAKTRDGIVSKPRDLMQMYLLRNGLLFDIVVNAPIAISWNFVNQSSYGIATRELMRYARLLAFGRMVVLKSTLKKIMVELDFSPAAQLLANVVVFCVVSANAMACYFYLLADDKDFYDALPIGFDPDVTPVRFSDCLEIASLTSNCTWFMYDRSKFPIKARYVRSLYWSLVILSSVGYGDIFSFTNSECLVGFWWIYLGALICYFTSCAVGSVVSQITVLRSAQDARVEEITRALVRTNVSRAMRVMIRSHYEANWEMNGSALSEESMMEHLPRSLRHQLSSSLYLQHIRQCCVFSCLGGQAAMLREIALLVSSEMFLPKVTIVEYGHLASALYIVLSGDVELLLPYDSSERTNSTARRRSLLQSPGNLRNPFFRFYQRLKYCLHGYRHQASSSVPSYAAPSTPKQQPLGIPITALKEGDCFGEEGLLLDRRSALRISARTLTGTQIAILSRDSFMSLTGRFPVQVRQIVALIAKKQEADTVLFDTIRGNFNMRHKAVEFMGMTSSLYCQTKPQVNSIITTDTLQYRVWRIIHAVVIIYNFYVITFRLAFLPRASKRTALAFTIIDYIADAVLYADIYLKLNRFGYEEYGNQIVDVAAIRRRYKKGWFRIDCLSMLPLYYYGDFFFMSVARLPRLLKSLQILETLDAVEALIREKFMKGSTTMLSLFDLFKFLLYFLSVAHHVGSIYFLLGRMLTEYKVETSSWMMVDVVINAYPGNILVQYNRAIYWCLGTFTVVCFGDVAAQSVGETIYAFCMCIVGWMCIGQIVGRITSLMANIDKDSADHNNRVDNFEKYARKNDLPQYLRERAIESAEYKSKSLIELNLRSTFEDLPPALHAMLFEEMYGVYVRRVPEFTQVMKKSQLRVLVDALVFRVYVMDDIIFEEGRLGSVLYIMKDGRAEYFCARSMIVFGAIYEGQLFGDTTFFIPEARHLSSVRASRSCQVLELERRKWNEIWDENSRRALEKKFAELVQVKLTSIQRAHTNISRNFGSSPSMFEHEKSETLLQDTLQEGFEVQPNDPHVPRSLAITASQNLLAQYKSSIRGYSTSLSAIKELLWMRFSRKVAPALGYKPVRRTSSRRTVIGGEGRSSQKIRRSLAISTAATMKHIGRAGQSGADADRYSASAYEQHLEAIKSRFKQRQERTMFDLPQFAVTTLAIETRGTTSEIWVDPPLPASFCLETSKFRRRWNFVMYLICLYFVLVVPFRVSFDYEFLSNDEKQGQVRAWFLIEYIMDALCIIDFVLNKNYFTFVNRGTLVTEKQAIRDHYLREGTYLMDLFAILPFEVLLPFAPLKNAPGTNAKVTWYRVAVFRLNKMVRIAHLHGLGEKLQRMLIYDVKVSFVRPSVIYFVRHALNFVLGAHWVACLFYGASFNGIDDDRDSWLKAAGMLTFEGRANAREVGTVAVEMKYARSYHFSIGAITTVTYGDITPLNALETFVATVVMFISVVHFSLLSGGFFQIFEVELGQRADYEEKIASVAHFMTFHQFPTRIWKQMQSYFLVYWSESQGMNEEELLVGLPLSVKNDITLFVKQAFVKQMRLFAGCDEAFVRAVVAAFDQELFVRNDVIITFGDRGRSLYVIESGSVLVRIPQSPVVASKTNEHASLSVSVAADIEIIKGRFDFFGEKSLIFDIPRSATCIALSSCTMLILTVDKYDAIIESFPEYREKNMRDWIFLHPGSGTKNQAIPANLRVPTAAMARRHRAAVGVRASATPTAPKVS